MLHEAISAYEAEFGVIAATELKDQERADRLSARVPLGPSPTSLKRRRRGAPA
jgi:hypothetical protein